MSLRAWIGFPFRGDILSDLVVSMIIGWRVLRSADPFH